MIFLMKCFTGDIEIINCSIHIEIMMCANREALGIAEGKEK